VQGSDLTPVLADPRPRSGTTSCSPRTRPDHRAQQGAVRPPGFYDGATSTPGTTGWRRKALYRPVGQVAGGKLFDVDCAFDDNDHEWYDHDSDPHELVNLANDRARRSELRDVYERMRAYEQESFVTFG